MICIVDMALFDLIQDRLMKGGRACLYEEREGKGRERIITLVLIFGYKYIRVASCSKDKRMLQSRSSQKRNS